MPIARHQPPFKFLAIGTSAYSWQPGLMSKTR
jgi:hypothetical protein